MSQFPSSADRAKTRRNLFLAGAVFALGLLGVLDATTTQIRVGALVVCPLLVIAYYTNTRIAVVISILAAPAFAFFDRDSFQSGHINYYSLSIDAASLAIAFVAVVLLASAMQRTRRRHSELSLEYERVRKLAESDHLTALPNRANFIDRLDALLAATNLEPRQHGVLFCDLDDFKGVNDANGHRIGDLLLIGIGERLRGALRGNDLVGRIGGDEFAVLVEGARDRSEVATVAKKLDAALAPPFLIQGREVRVRISTGCALFPDDGQTASDLLAAADAQMYHAKRTTKSLRPASIDRSPAVG